MSTVPLISVIIPAYNAERFLRATLASAQAQSYRNLEIIVVDDGSTDATAKIAEEAAQSDHRIRVIHQPNLGVAAARNRGLAEARGEFIAPLDADDVWHPLNLALQVEALNKANPDVAVSYAWFLAIDAHGTFCGNGPQTQLRSKQEVLLGQLRGNFIGNASSTVMRRTAVEAVGGYNVTLRARNAQGCEDQALYMSLAQKWDFTFVPHYLIAYRKHPGSMSMDADTMARSQGFVLADLRHLSISLPRYWFARGIARIYEGPLTTALSRKRWRKAAEVIKNSAGISFWSLVLLLGVRLPVRIVGFCKRRLAIRAEVPEPERRFDDAFWSLEIEPATARASFSDACSLHPVDRSRI